ncbi:MAG: hypothetical protein KGL59_06795 [Acidobacteriota bacterium]|nr:hypothetical protein [Acidobacteriota bacterium]
MAMRTRAASAGFGLLLRRQYLLWWIFAVNFVLAALATLPTALSMAGVMGHSLYSNRLVTGFDVGVLIELLMRPQVNGGTTLALFPLVFLVFMLLVEGGILVSYRQDRRLGTGEFFGAGGKFFWRFVRLMVCMLAVLVPLFFAWGALSNWSDRLSSNSPNPYAGFQLELSGGVIFLLVFLALRLWFDMAQVRLVATEERSVLRALRWALGTTLRSFGSLYWLFLRISLTSWIVLVVVVWIWMNFVPHEHMGLSFLLGQFVLLFWLAARLWQRAGETVWYERRIETVLPN